MSLCNFEDVIDGYRKQTYSRLVEDFVAAFVVSGFTHDELVSALADALSKCGFDRAAVHLERGALTIRVKSKDEIQK